jgi:hypothetical protein
MVRVGHSWRANTRPWGFGADRSGIFYSYRTPSRYSKIHPAFESRVRRKGLWAWTMYKNLEVASLWVGSVVTVLGFLAFLVVSLRWPWISGYYREFWPKLLVAVFRFLAAGAAVAGKASATIDGISASEEPWVATLFVAVSGFLAWEAVGAVGDHKYQLVR